MVHMTELVPCFVVALLGGLLRTEAQMQNAFGFVGTSVTMECPDASSATGAVRWVDAIYTFDRNPVEIFTSENNPNRDITATHKKKDNYEVDDKFSLTILNVSRRDAGKVWCEVQYNATTKIKTEYKLNTVDQPDCMGQTTVSEGDLVTLSCQSSFRGQFPSLEWLKGKEKLTVVDNSKPKLAKQMVTFNAQPKDNGQMYQCRLFFAGTNVERECHLIMDVHYAATGVLIQPKKTNFAVGEEVNCSAQGNPVPTIKWEPMVPGGKEGKGWKSFKVPATALGKTVTYKCTASNTILSKPKSSSSDITILGQKAMPPTEGGSTGNGNNKEVNGSGSEDTQIAGIIGGMVAMVVIVIIIIIIVVYIKRRNQRKGAKRVPTKEEEVEMHNSHKA